MTLLPTSQNACLATALVLMAGCLGASEANTVPAPAAAPTAPRGFADDAAVDTPPVAPAQPPTLPTPPLSASWSLRGCRTAIAGMPVSADTLRGVLPAGFVPLTPEELLGVPDSRGDAMLMLMVQSCASSTGPDGPTGPVANGDIHIPVRAPAGFNVTAALHALRVDPLIAGPALRETVEAQGGLAMNGSVEFVEDGPVGSWRHVRATMHVAGRSFVVEGMPAVPVSGKEEFTYAAYTALAEGRFFVWTSRVLNADFTVGEGHAELPPGWARDAAGSETYYLPYVLHTIQDHLEGRLVLATPEP